MKKAIETLQEFKEVNKDVSLADSEYPDLLSMLSFSVNEDPKIGKKEKNDIKLKINELQQELEDYSNGKQTQ